ncbi:MAG: hypothetical protein WCY54_09745, partial [Syntrophales bacterium]
MSFTKQEVCGPGEKTINRRAELFIIPGKMRNRFFPDCPESFLPVTVFHKNKGDTRMNKDIFLGKWKQ